MSKDRCGLGAPVKSKAQGKWKIPAYIGEKSHTISELRGHRQSQKWIYKENSYKEEKHIKSSGEYKSNKNEIPSCVEMLSMSTN